MGYAAGVSRGLCFEVGQADLSVTRMVETRLGPPEAGEVLFEVETFAFSANNVTYALLGEALSYWDLFPAEPGWAGSPSGATCASCPAACRHLGRQAGLVIAGGTHGEAGALAMASPGGRIAVFSAPEAIRDLAREWGWALLDQRFRAALESFAAHAASWLAIRRHRGLADAGALYQRVRTNEGSPAEAHLIDV